MTDPTVDPVAREDRRLPAGVQISAFLRSFAIQGSWNYRTMIGQGFAFSLLPILRYVYGSDEEALERAIERHAHYFNAHPYMAEVALGAVARMELEGRPAETMDRFKDAVRSPLGSIGDRLIWAGALPAAALAAVAVGLVGGPIWLPPLLFLLTYNAVHLSLRIWAFRTGLREGAEVARKLAAVRLPTYAEVLTAAGTCLLGAVVAFGAVRLMPTEVGWDWVPAAAAAAAFVLGSRSGNESWRMAAWIVVFLLCATFAFGVAS